MGKKILDLVGKKFGRLTVLAYACRNPRGKSMWECRCDCGNTRVVLGCHLTSGHTTSCGCFNAEVRKSRAITHGMSKTRLYNIWRVMLKRCNCPYSTSYGNYGEKGIKVCDEWHEYAKFQEWATANGYLDKLTIDRIDNNGNYTPENCRWVDMKTQERNTSHNKVITFRGETHCLIEWAEILNMNYRTLQQRINTGGWSIEKAFTTPIYNRGGK